MTREEFQELLNRDKMLEHAEYCGNYYGTPSEPIEKWLSHGHDAVSYTHLVARLKRIAVGPVKLGMLQPGKWRELTKEEIRALKREATGTAEKRPQKGKGRR